MAHERTNLDNPYFFRSGTLRIVVEIYGTNSENREVARGYITTPSGFKWTFDDLASGCGGYAWNGGHAGDTLAHAMAAESILAFASYYTSSNRAPPGEEDDDLPSWAPPASICDEIEREAEFRDDTLTPVGPLPEDDSDPTGYAGDLFVVSHDLEAARS